MIVVFSGYNQRAVIALLRGLPKNFEEKVIIIARDINDPILMTKYSKNVFYIRKFKELNKNELDSVFEKIIKFCNEEIIIMPTTEALNRYLLEKQDELLSRGIIVPLVNKLLYSKISDKRSFWNMCKNTGLKVPSLISIDNNFVSPYVAKPVKYISSTGVRLAPIIVMSNSEHLNFLENYNITDFDIQEYIEGQSYYLLYYFSKNGQCYSYSQCNLAQQPGGKSIIAAISSNLHYASISDDYINLFKKNHFFGFVMVELRKKGSEYYMIEANPRLWGPSQLFVDANVKFIEAFLMDYGLIKSFTSGDVHEDSLYFWSGGLRNDILVDDECVWLDGGREIVTKRLDEFKLCDVYNRTDTEKVYLLEKKLWEREL